jgi:hypothetical protein
MSTATRLTLAVAVPPAVYALFELFGWFASSHACPGTAQPWSMTGARWLVVVATAVALCATVPGLTAGVRAMRYGNGDPEQTSYLSMFAALVGATMVFAVVTSGLAALILRSCGEVR